MYCQQGNKLEEDESLIQHPFKSMKNSADFFEIWVRSQVMTGEGKSPGN